MRALAVVLILLAFPAFAAVRLAAADPAPGDTVYIVDNQVTLTFGEAVQPIDITVTDSRGRVVSTGKTDGTDYDIDVLLRAPDRIGYSCGPMTVRWHVKVIEDGRDERGEYSFNIRPHHGTVCHDHH
jgi:methionine-rich copper-binding protein CopC